MDITNANSLCGSNIQQQTVIADPALQYTQDELGVLIQCEYFNSELTTMLMMTSRAYAISALLDVSQDAQVWLCACGSYPRSDNVYVCFV